MCQHLPYIASMDKVKVTVRLPEKTRDQLARVSAADGRTQNWHVERAILNYLKSKKVAS